MSRETDHELLELAAKAAGYIVRCTKKGIFFRAENGWCGEWNPLEDDGDALRLAVKLKFNIHVWDFIDDDDDYEGGTSVIKSHPDGETPDDESEDWIFVGNEDPYAATRLAIVKAAAEIGKEMK